MYLLNLNKYYTSFTNWHHYKVKISIFIVNIGNLRIGFINKNKTYNPQCWTYYTDEDIINLFISIL